MESSKNDCIYTDDECCWVLLTKNAGHNKIYINININIWCYDNDDNFFRWIYKPHPNGILFWISKVYFVERIKKCYNLTSGNRYCLLPNRMDDLEYYIGYPHYGCEKLDKKCIEFTA